MGPCDLGDEKGRGGIRVAVTSGVVERVRMSKTGGNAPQYGGCNKTNRERRVLGQQSEWRCMVSGGAW